MRIIFHDTEDETNLLNGAAIHTSDRLRQILYSLKDREPFCCVLVGENGSELCIGIGEVGFAEYSRDDDALYMLARTKRNVIAGTEEDFLAGGTPTPVPAHFCMPFDDVIKIAVYFIETGNACPPFSWEEIGPDNFA